jgi:hypothetical protein
MNAALKDTVWLRSMARSRRLSLPEDQEFSVSSEQSMAARQPHCSIRALVATQPQGFAGRPYVLWRDDPELARALNDRLVPDSD